MRSITPCSLPTSWRRSAICSPWRIELRVQPEIVLAYLLESPPRVVPQLDNLSLQLGELALIVLPGFGELTLHIGELPLSIGLGVGELMLGVGLGFGELPLGVGPGFGELPLGIVPGFGKLPLGIGLGLVESPVHMPDDPGGRTRHVSR